MDVLQCGLVCNQVVKGGGQVFTGFAGCSQFVFPQLFILNNIYKFWSIFQFGIF